MRQLAISLFTFLSICACTHTDRSMPLEKLPLSHIVLDWNGQTVQLDTAGYEISKILSLDMDTTLFIGQIDKMEIYGGYIFVLDKEYAKKVFVFDSVGHMTACVGEIGHADKEFLRGPSDFAIDKQNNELCVFEAETNKIIRFTFDGELLSTTKIDEYWPYSFSVLNSGKYVFAFRMIDNNKSTDGCEVVVSDTLMNVQKRWRPLERHHLFTKDFPFWSNGEQTFYVPNLSDTVLVFNSDSIVNRVYVDFQGHFIDSETAAKIKYDGDYKAANDKGQHVYSICKYEENEYWINIEYNIGVMMHYLRNKKTGKSYQGVSLFDGIFPIHGVTVSDKHIACIITAESIEQSKYMIDSGNSDIRAAYARTNQVIRDMINGKLSLPALLYIKLR